MIVANWQGAKSLSGFLIEKLPLLMDTSPVRSQNISVYNGDGNTENGKAAQET